MTDSESRPARRTRPADLRRTVRLFRSFAGPRGPYWAGCGLLVVEAVTAVVEPIPIAYLIDYLQGARGSLRDLGAPALLASEQFETILLLTVAIVLIAAVNSAADSLTEVAMARGGRSLGYSIRVAMYAHLQRLPLAYHDTKRTGDVITRVTGDVLVVEDFVVKSLSNILGSVLVLVGSFVFLLTQSWNVALVAVVVIPMLALVSNHYSRRIKVASRTQRDREGELASTAQEMLTSIRLVQSYGRGTVDLQRFSGQTEQSMRASLSAANIQAQFSFVIALVEALSISAVVWLGVWLLDREAITVGTLVLFVLLLQNMFKPARKIVSEWYKIGKVFASVERIDDLLDREIVVRDRPGARTAPPLEGRLTFRHVGFTYPSGHEDGSVGLRPPVLTDIDFDLAPGEVVSLVGYSGAGKSTVAQLVPRLYDADEGEVLVDGLPVQDLTLASLRSQVSLVLQDTVLLSGSVADNIGYGIADATRADIEEAARLANAHDFIMELPDGYDTELGERGATLSGGQRQRLAIARAFIRHAPILILDEPTTGLDAESSRSVVEALQCLMQGRTTIVISHDLGLVRSATRVLVMSEGRIVESGPPEQLMHEGGTYADLFFHPSSAPSVGRGPLRGTSRPPPGLANGLGTVLPGLTQALDPDFATAQVRSLLLEPEAPVQSTTVGQVWLRADGTCSLRYTVRLAGGQGPVELPPLLGRLHRDEESATAYRDRVVRHHGRAGLTDALRTWRDPVSTVADVGLVLHPFPIDPDLPTLAASMDARAVGQLLRGRAGALRSEVDVVHHPREGPCVVRYRFEVGTDRPPDVVYGKVFSDRTGAAVDRYLRALAGREGDAPPGLARVPRPVTYVPALRLLCTEALPGEPLRRLLVGARGGGARSAQQTAALAESAGRALAALHRGDVPDVPTHSAADELAGLRRSLEPVTAVWPEQAERIRRHVEQLGACVPEPATTVVCHGDFTPSQVLLDGDRPAIVDLDTLCRADPALDLGRFLAHVRLLVAKLTGNPFDPLSAELARAFLGAYDEEAGRPVTGDRERRVAFYAGTTLARSATHACRQLKDERVEIALQLLSHVPLSKEVEL